MSILTDPHLCPECRSPLDTDATCTGCGLRLVGPPASRLWHTMQTAATLVEELRQASAVSRPVDARVSAGSPSVPPPVLPVSRTAGLRVAPPVTPTPRRPRALSGGSVPVVLFGVGALCLLVAAIVFVAVAWSSLGLGARTTILLGVTTGFGAVAAILTRRGLRGAAETFWSIVGALVTIDLTAAYGAGLLGFDRVPDRHAAAVVGAALLLLGLGVGSWVRRVAAAQLVAGTVFATLGALTLAATEAWSMPSPAVPTTVSILALSALALAAVRLTLRSTAYAVTGVAVLAWGALVVIGLSRAAEATTSSWWTGLDGWPLFVAGSLAASVASYPRCPEPVRTAAAAAAEIVLALMVVGPGAGANTELVVTAAVAIGLAGIAVVGSRVWALPAACLTVFSLLVSVVAALVRPTDALDGLPRTAPEHHLNLGFRLPADGGELLPWTALVVVAVVLVSSLALIGWIGDPARRRTALQTWTCAAPTLVAVAVATMVLASGPTLVVAVAVWASAFVVLAGLATWVRGAAAPFLLAVAAYLGVVGFTLAVGSHLLAALLTTVVALGAAVAHRRTTSQLTQVGTAAATVFSAGFAATHWPYLTGGTGDAAGLCLVGVAVTAGLFAAKVARGPADRLAIELTAFAAALAALGFGVHDSAVIAVLTLTGTAVALVAVLNRDREHVAWLGTAILCAAAIARADSALAIPELTTAPAAALLLLAGIRRLRLDADVSSVRALGSGLVLALSPTLVLALDDPASARSIVVGALAIAALGLGVRMRTSAPFLAGAGALSVLAVRHLGPVAEALPRWISLGTVGIALLLVAITWESRRQELAAAERYLTALR